MKTPMGAAGLVRYEEDAESKIKMEPKIVIFIAVAIIIMEIVLFTFF
jgi:preprotein translocase subunit Sec61beta